jgi:hypothetical protein
MQLSTIKTTVTFSPAFLERLKAVAQERRSSVSRLIEEELTNLLREREERQLRKMYASIRKWQGSGSPGITDASQTIDVSIYGAKGDWKGRDAG